VQSFLAFLGWCFFGSFLSTFFRRCFLGSFAFFTAFVTAFGGFGSLAFFTAFGGFEIGRRNHRGFFHLGRWDLSGFFRRGGFLFRRGFGSLLAARQSDDEEPSENCASDPRERS